MKKLSLTTGTSLAAIALSLCLTAGISAVYAGEAKKDAPADKAEAPKKEAKAGEKAALGDDPLAEAKKMFPAVAALRAKADKLHDEQIKHESASTPAEQKKAKTALPKIEKQLADLQDKMKIAVEAAKKPLEADLKKISDKDGKLVEVIGKIEAKSGKADKETDMRNKLNAEMEKIQLQERALDDLSDIDYKKK